jgi:antitoxin component YwqK of YwqJK toxin-antitoxin module
MRASSALLCLALLGCRPGYEVCTTHYPEGKVWSVRYYELAPDGSAQPHRPWIVWWKSGAPRHETAYEHGRRSGTWRSFDERGTLRFERNYAEDEPHGAWRRFDAAGQLTSEVHYQRGVPRPAAGARDS